MNSEDTEFTVRTRQQRMGSVFAVRFARLPRLLSATVSIVLGSALLASAAAAQQMGGLADSYPTGPNVAYKNVAPNKVQITISRPTTDDDAGSWADFIRAVFQQNVSPSVWPGGWPVLVGQSELAVEMQAHEKDVFKDWVADRRLRAGDILGLGGPRSRATADMMIKSFSNAPPNWAKGATLMFMGSLSDKDRVFAALRSSGATLRFFDLDKVQAVSFEHVVPHFNGPVPPPPPPPGSH
jgi:hypothetical protein